MDAASNNTLPEITPVKRRRKHSAAFKARVLAACAQPDASVAAVAQQYQLNANLIHKWRKAIKAGAQPLAESTEFLPIPIATAGAQPTTVTLTIGELTIQWPISHINQAVDWLKALQS